MEKIADIPVSVAALDSELIALKRMALRVATTGGFVTAALGLIVVAGDSGTGVPHLAIQGMFVVFSGLAALRALFPGDAAYRQAATLFCWAITLGFGTRAVISFMIAQPEWLDSGTLPRLAVWATFPLIVNYLFLPRRDALLLSGVYYVLVAAAVLYAAQGVLSGGELPRSLLAMLLFFVFVGIPFSIGTLSFLVYSHHRYQDLSYQLEIEARERRRESECDDVTDCLNRRGLLRRLEGVAASEQALLLAVEVDNITRHLQILGGTGTHRMLAWLGRQLKEVLSESAVVARWDAGRFYVFLPTLDQPPMSVASQLLEVGRRGMQPSVASGGITLSIGACVIAPGSNISDYMEEVDLRLFLAQSEGGNCIRLEATGVGSASPS